MPPAKSICTCGEREGENPLNRPAAALYNETLFIQSETGPEHRMNDLTGKTVVLGVSGGIACYKAVELLRLLRRAGARVLVVMTENARRFVTPLTFEVLSEQPVYDELFPSQPARRMEHIRAAEEGDVLIVAPATANTLARFAQGLADDPLSTLYTAFRGPVLVAPAMNDGMWAHPAVQENLRTLRGRGVTVVEPESGELACGSVGPGRLADPARLLEAVQRRLDLQTDWRGIRVLVTAGPTREPLDPVRFITNHSSGKMGYAIARQARARGAEVVLVSGPTHLDPPPGVRVVPCQRAGEMRERVLQQVPDCDVLIMAAAVGDFAPETVQKEKIKKRGEEALVLRLRPTPDILREVTARRPRPYVVGFAAESGNVIENALAKWKDKNLDLVVANDISAPGIGFQADDNQVTLVAGPEAIEPLPRMTKLEVADRLLDRIREALPRSG